jgi:hypothetical protein
MVIGVAPILSGLATCINVDGTGQLRHLYLSKCENSGVIRLVVYSDNGLVLDGQGIFSSGLVMSNVDIVSTSMAGSGATLISGAITTVEPISFTQNLSVQYTVTSGSVTVRALVDLNKMIIQT